MIFLYNCYGGTHSSSLASAIHLGKLPTDRIPSKEEILNTAYFDKLTSKDMGTIVYRGTDRWGNKVYSMGRGSSRVLLFALKNLLNLIKTECNFNEEIVLINASPTVTFPMTIGGFLSRKLKLYWIGRYLLVLGVQQNYFGVVELVRSNLAKYGLKLD